MPFSSQPSDGNNIEFMPENDNIMYIQDPQTKVLVGHTKGNLDDLRATLPDDGILFGELKEEPLVIDDVDENEEMMFEQLKMDLRKLYEQIFVVSA